MSRQIERQTRQRRWLLYLGQSIWNISKLDILLNEKLLSSEANGAPFRVELASTIDINFEINEIFHLFINQT